MKSSNIVYLIAGLLLGAGIVCAVQGSGGGLMIAPALAAVAIAVSMDNT